MHWPLTVFTVLTNWLLGKFLLPVYLQFHESKQRAEKTPCGQKLPRYEVSESNFHFDESIVP